jgi:hypothetical protein
MKTYRIYSPKHTKGIAVWWRPDSCGYTQNILEAGLYSKEEAEETSRSSHGDAVAISPELFGMLVTRTIIDLEGSNWSILATEQNRWSEAK